MRLVWEDDFNGPTLNTSLWNVLDQVHRGGVYSRDNVRLENGALVLSTLAKNLTVGGRRYYVTSGAVNTSGHAEQRTGRWEARVKLPLVGASAGYTLHSSIWLFSDASNTARSGCLQEIDVVEQYAAGGPTYLPSRAAANLHPFNGTRATGCHKVTYAQPTRTAATGDWTGIWTRFAVDWTDEWIAMSVDDRPYAEYDRIPSAVASFTDPLFLALTACVMERIPPTAIDKFPLEYLVDWVKVYAWV
jgi:beta-glucanase (GH16 family)